MSDFVSAAQAGASAQAGACTTVREFPTSISGDIMAGGFGGAAVGAEFGLLNRIGIASPNDGFGSPFLRVTYEGVPWPAAAWALSDGTLVLKIGCETRLLDDWETGAEKHASGYGKVDVLRALCGLVRVAQQSLRRGEAPTPQDPDIWTDELVSALFLSLDERVDLRERVRAHLADSDAAAHASEDGGAA